MKPVILMTKQADACSFYRGAGPLGRLRQQGKIDFITADQIDWTILSQAHVVFINRPEAAWHLQLAKMCRDWNVPLWADFDDDLLWVPEDNPTYKHYSSPTTQSIIKECLGLSRLVTSSTFALANVLAPHTSNVRVIPNGLDPRFNGFNLESPTNKIVLWRGSKTHDKDIDLYSDAIIESARSNPGWRWHFQGYNPWRLVERLREYGHITWSEPLPVEEYMKFLSTLNPAIMMVPLVDHEFNRSKSNIAWIEGTLAGAATLAPDWEEWRNPGVTLYKNKEEFTEELSSMMNKKKMSSVHKSTEYIHSHLKLDLINERRMNLISDVMRTAK